MRITSLIENVDKQLNDLKQSEKGLVAQKARFLTIQEKYPDSDVYRNIICVNDGLQYANKMRIEPHYMLSKDKKQWTRHITLKFPLDLPSPLEGMSVYANPYRTSVAEITFDYSAQQRRGSIFVLDYPSLIPDSCKNKEAFIRRIRHYVARHTLDYKYNLQAGSFDEEYLSKMIMLS